MRIISGRAKGMKLLSPKGLSTRPMTDMAKEAAFNILGDRVLDTVVLDLFAGSGALGLEALSRGALECYFVEKDPQTVKVLEANVEKARLVKESRVFCRDVFTTLHNFPEVRFQLCFFDPPYSFLDNPVSRRHTIEFLGQLAGRYAAEGASIVVHYRKGAMAGFPLPKPLALWDTRGYGSTELMFLQKAGVISPESPT